MTQLYGHHSSFKALILGVVEGLTEFLPISSTGHLIILGDLLGYNDETSKVFKIVIQLAAILAVCWDYRERLTKMLVGLPSDKPSQRFATMLFIGFLPAAVLDSCSIHRSRNCCSTRSRGDRADHRRLHHPVCGEARLPSAILSVDEMGWRDALKVGFAQALAMIPGTSRSGATIMGGLVFGLSRKTAAEFSFFLAIPTMFAATAYDLYKNWALLSVTTCRCSRWVSSPRSSRRCGR